MGRKFYFEGETGKWWTTLLVTLILGCPVLASADHSWGVITVSNPLPDATATAGNNFVFEIPANTFNDPDANNTDHKLTYSTGSLPDWLRFDPNTVTFSGIPANEHHGVVTVEVTADDGNGNVATDAFDITVQAIPVVDINGVSPGINYDQAILQEDGLDTVAITDPDSYVGDEDGTTITEALISLSDVGLYDRTEEYLIITDAGIRAARDAGLSEPYYNPVQGYIIITGEAPFEKYDEVLREVRYVNTAEDLQEGSRSVVFLVNDRDGNEANAAISIITIVPVNDPPVFDLDSSDGPDSSPGEDNYLTEFREGGSAVAVADDKISLEDIDYGGGGSATISLVNRPDSTQETLRLLADLPAGISVSFNDTTGVATLSGSASLDDYEEAIQRIGYHNASEDPDQIQRRVSIVFDDGGGGESTGSAITLVDIVPVNDPPKSQVDTVIVAEYSRNNIVSATLPTDIDNDLSELTIRVVNLPDLGRLLHADGTPVRTGDALDSTRFVGLRYDAPDNYDGISPAGHLTYNVSDGNLNALGAMIFVVNNSPEADDITVTTQEDISYVFTLADFANEYTDTEGDALAYVVINSLPADGWLLLGDDTVRVNDEIRISALDSGKLVLHPKLHAYGDPYTSFLFRVKDEQTATSEPYVAVIIVTPVSDPPTVDTVRISGEEHQTLFFTAADFTAQFSDPEDDTLTKVKIERLPTGGTLLLNGRAVAVGEEIPVDSLNQLAFKPDPGFDGTTEFQWNGHDGSVYAERSAPVIITIVEDNRISASNDTIRLVDVVTYEGTLAPLVNNPTGGDVTFRTNPVISPEHGSVTLYEDGTYTYEVADGFVGTDAFTYEVCNTATSPGCAQATVFVVVPPPLLIYEGFSPDNDNVNDVWRIRGIEDYPNNHVRIFNRWGNLVFEIERYNNEDRAWSSYSTAGLVAGDVPDGTYFYLIDLGNGQPPRSGYVIVNR